MYGLLPLFLCNVVEDWCISYISIFAYSKLAKYSDFLSSAGNAALQKGQFLIIFAGYIACNMNAIVHGMHVKLWQLEQVYGVFPKLLHTVQAFCVMERC